MIDPNDGARLDRRGFGRLSAGLALALGLARSAHAQGRRETAPEAFLALRGKPLSIGVLIFPDMDQIDFTGPFEVLARVPDAKVHVIGTQAAPFKDHLGLTLTPDCDLAGAPPLDLLQVPGGPGQQALMDHEPTLAFIRGHMAAGRPLFSVCTGALICGAAGVLRNRRATTHWSAFDLLGYFGAAPVRRRVVVDGNLVSAAGVTAGIDGALRVAALLRGDEAAERIQLDIQYAPEPPFHAGTPETAPSAVLAAVKARYAPLTRQRLETAKAVARRLAASPA
jgi:cyclohexyl-isocyanide hydratase